MKYFLNNKFIVFTIFVFLVFVIMNINAMNFLLIFGQDNDNSNLVVCEKPTVKSISASGALTSQPPKNAIDGNPDTRWSVSGMNSWIQADLGKKISICNVEISWFNGNQRINSFTIEASNDGKNFKEILNTKSSGTTSDFEIYDTTDIKTRYLKITVTGNTQNNWVSITDIKFNDNKQSDKKVPNVPGAEPNVPFVPPSGYSDDIAVAGDWACGIPAQKTIKNVMTTEPSLLIVPGDMSYMETGDCWLDIVSPIDNIVKIIMGNHDVDEGNPPSLSHQYLEHYKLPNTYYSFNFKNIHFLMLNSETDFGVGSNQYNFVLKDLKQASADPNIQWIISVTHEPIYTSPTKHSPQREFRDMYHHIFDQYEVDFVIHGHVHNYQRSYPLTYNENNPDFPTITSKNKNTYVDPVGEIYLITGTGGRLNHALNGQSDFIAQQYKGFGFLDLKLSTDGRTIKGTFYSNNNMEVIDEFVVQKTDTIKQMNPNKNYINDRNADDLKTKINPLDSIFSDILKSTPRYK